MFTATAHLFPDEKFLSLIKSQVLPCTKEGNLDLKTFFVVVYVIAKRASRCLWLCVIVGCTFCLADTKDTSEQLLLEEWVFPAKQAEPPELQCVFVCVHA